MLFRSGADSASAIEIKLKESLQLTTSRLSQSTLTETEQARIDQILMGTAAEDDGERLVTLLSAHSNIPADDYWSAVAVSISERSVNAYRPYFESPAPHLFQQTTRFLQGFRDSITSSEALEANCRLPKVMFNPHGYSVQQQDGTV